MSDKEIKGDKINTGRSTVMESRIEGESDGKTQKSYIVNVQGYPEKYVHEV